MPGSSFDITRVVWVCAAALVVFSVWLATPGSANVGIGFLYTVPIGLAAWWGGARPAAVTAVGCIGLYVLGAAIQPVEGFGPVLLVRVTIFAGVATSVVFIRRRLVFLEHSAEELEELRAALTPAALPQLADVDAAAAFVPSEYGVSGDFYLLTNGPDGSALAIVGDVVGHGPGAARLATFIRARLAAFAANTSDPAELLALANTALVERSTGGEKLVSAACVRYRAAEEQFSWALAGHPPPLNLPSLGELSTGGESLPLGAQARLPLRNAEAALRDEDGIVLYTDGATDVRREGALLGLEGLTRLLVPLAELPAWGITSKVEQAILAWTDEPIRDDLCLLVLKPKRGPA